MSCRAETDQCGFRGFPGGVCGFAMQVLQLLVSVLPSTSLSATAMDNLRACHPSKATGVGQG